MACQVNNILDVQAIGDEALARLIFNEILDVRDGEDSAVDSDSEIQQESDQELMYNNNSDAEKDKSGNARRRLF